MTRQAAPASGLVDLGRRLVGEVARLLDQRLELLKVELKQGTAEISRSLGLVVGGLVGGSVGVMFALLALGLWIGDWVGSTPGGLVIVGGALVLIGGGLALAGLRGLRHQTLAPETVRQFRRDAEWIQDEG